MDIAEPGTAEKRVEFPPDQGVPAHLLLENDEPLNRLPCTGVIGMEECRAVIAFDHRDRPPFFEERAEPFKGLLGIGKVFEHKTEEYVVEAGRAEWQGENIRLPEGHVRYPGLPGLLFCLGKRLRREIARGYDRTRAIPGMDHGLGDDPAASFQNMGAGRIPRVVVKEGCKGLGLVRKTF